MNGHLNFCRTPDRQPVSTCVRVEMTLRDETTLNKSTLKNVSRVPPPAYSDSSEISDRNSTPEGLF